MAQSNSPHTPSGSMMSSGDRHGSVDRILCAAARVFAERGFSGATVQEVAEEAGVTKPTVYNHFGGKGALYVAVMERTHQDILARLRQAASRPGTAYERVLGLIESQVAAAIEYADLVRVAHSVAFLPKHKRPQVDGHRFWLERFAVWEQVMADGEAARELQGDPQDIALTVYGMVSSVAMARILAPEGPLLTDDVERRLWEVIYSGAKRR